MKNLSIPIFGLLLLCLSSCINIVNTRQSLLSREPVFQQNDVFLMDKVKGLPHSRSESLYDWATTKGEKRLQQSLAYLPMKEYELFSHGLDYQKLDVEELSDEAKQLIHEVTGATYLVRVDVLGRYTDSRYSNQYNLEIANGNQDKASLRFNVIHLLNDTYSYNFRLRTTIDRIWLYGTESASLSGAYWAAQTAFIKGWKRVLRGMKH